MPRIIFTWFNALSGPAKGVVWMLLAAFCLTGMAVAVRYLSQSLHTFEIVFFRTALGVPLMLPWLYDEIAEMQALMGANAWAYGVERNRPLLEAFMQYLVEQAFLEAPTPIDDLFAPIVGWSE